MAAPSTEKIPHTKSTATETTNGAAKSDTTLSLDVEPRKPRLAWQGMDRKEAAVSVPTQVVEIVRPGKAIATDDKLPGITAAQQTARAQELPPVGSLSLPGSATI